MRGFPALLLIATHAWAAPATLVWDGPGVTLLGAPSRDGRYLSFAEAGTGHLAWRDLGTGESRVLVRAAGKQFAYFSAIAPDSASVAYAWFNAEGFYDLRVVDAKTGAVRVLYANDEAGFVQPCAFTPDGQQILTLFFRKDNISQIALVPVAGGAPKVLRSLNWVYPKKMDFSPDGKFIVYDSFAEDGRQDRTLFALRVDGQGETRLITTPGNHLFPVWTAAGVVYASGDNVWLLPVRDGKPAGDPRVVLPGLGRLVPLGETREGEYFYGLRAGTVEVEVLTLDIAQGRMDGAPRGVSLKSPGRNSAPAWSPDGKRIAYLSRRGTENFGEAARAIVVRSLLSTAEKELDAGLAHIASVRWLWDSKELLVAGTDGQGRGGLFSVHAETGASALVLRDDAAGTAGVDGHSMAADQFAYLTPRGVMLQRAGKTSELAAGSGFSLLAAGGERSLAWLARDGIHLFSSGRVKVLTAPATGLSELAFVGSELLAGNGKDLWLVPADGSAARPIAMKGPRAGRLHVHPDGKRIAYTTGGTQSSVWKVKLR